jgi:hypothetical protein
MVFLPDAAVDKLHPILQALRHHGVALSMHGQYGQPFLDFLRSRATDS